MLVSVGSMAFAFAGIDLQDGLNGIPGLLKHWLSPVAWRSQCCRHAFSPRIFAYFC